MTATTDFSASPSPFYLAPTAALVLRIRKLLALAKDNRGNEHEMAVAAAKVQELCQDHGVSLAELELTATSTPSDKRERTTHDRAAMYVYQRKLMEALAANHFCMHWVGERIRPDARGKGIWDPTTSSYIVGRRVKSHVLLGRQSNVDICCLLYDYLVETMDRLLPYQGMEKRGRDALLWLEGCADRLVERLRVKRQEAEAESLRRAKDADIRSQHPGAVPSNALMLSDVYSSETDLNTDSLFGYEPGTTARNRKIRAAEAAAYLAKLTRKEQEFLAAGHTQNEAWRLARGFPLVDAPITMKPETERQRQKREERDQRYWDRQSYRQERAQDRQERKTSSAAYRSGRATGESIGLDAQVHNNSRKERLG